MHVEAHCRSNLSESPMINDRSRTLPRVCGRRNIAVSLKRNRSRRADLSSHLRDSPLQLSHVFSIEYV